MKPTIKPKRTAEQRTEEEAIRRQHAANPIRQRPAGAANQQSFAAILRLLSRFKAMRESQGLTLAEVAERMGIDPPALSRLETGKVLNPTLATLHKWAEAVGQKLDVDLSSFLDDGANGLQSKDKNEPKMRRRTMSAMQILTDHGLVHAGMEVEPVPEIMPAGTSLVEFRATILNPTGGANSIRWRGEIRSLNSMLRVLEREHGARGLYGVHRNFRLVGHEKSLRDEAEN